MALSWSKHPPPHTFEEAAEKMWKTSECWRQWINIGDFPDHPWRSYLQRSALTLKGLTYSPTGALLAASTTSLPETPQGERNWDYRYAWVRDSTFALWGLYTLGLDREADDFFAFIADVSGANNGERHPLQVMYGVGGERSLIEEELHHLSGYDNSRPVRIGNGAYNQMQHDIWGTMLDSVYLHAKSREQFPDTHWPVLKEQVQEAIKHWKDPDRGIWEVRGEPQHFTSSKIMCWVALDRGSKLAALKGERSYAQQWREIAEEIKADVLAKGVDNRGVLTQRYEDGALDASLLLAVSPGSYRPTIPGSGPPCWRSPTNSPRRAWCCATASRRPTTDSPARRAPSPFARSGWSRRSSRSVNSIGPATCANVCSRSPVRYNCMPRKSSHAPDAIWATSRRRLPTWR